MKTILLNYQNGESSQWPLSIWELLLMEAYAHGWRPAGTMTPADFDTTVDADEWDRNYTSGSGQGVLVEDARALANAIHRSRDNIAPQWHEELQEMVEWMHTGEFHIETYK